MTEDRKWFLVDQVRPGPWGGGNAFLRGFSAAMKRRDLLAETWEEAHFVLTNSFPFEGFRKRISTLERIKKGNSTAKIIHRIDGPISASRGYPRHDFLDKAVFSMNKQFADLTIFQSQWSFLESLKLGYEVSSETSVIGNAVDKSVFYPLPRTSGPGSRVALITSSWSGNRNKGMSAYNYLDENLDVSRFRYRFFGPPQPFSNIENMGRVPPEELVKFLQQGDFFITASRNDSCSNSLLEAMACGLTPLAFSHGGHPEIVKNADFLFESAEELLAKLDSDLRMEAPESSVMSFDQVADLYHSAADSAPLVKNLSPDVSIAKPKLPASTIDAKKTALELDDKLGRILTPRLEHSLRRRIFGQPVQDYWSISSRDFLMLSPEAMRHTLVEFLESMHHELHPHLYRFSWSGDLGKQPLLISSVFAIKMHKLLRLRPSPELLAHVKSFQEKSGVFFEDYLLRPQPLADSLELIVSRKPFSQQRSDSIRAQNRQAVSALLEVNESVNVQDPILKSTLGELRQLVATMNWSNPWHSASHVSHMVFFLANSGMPARQSDAPIILEEAHRYFSPEKAASSDSWDPRMKVNGLMKLVTAYQWLSTEISESTARAVVDMCLEIAENRHACDQFNLLLVLRYFSDRSPGYRTAEIAEFAQIHKAGLASNYWPKFGGFSFYSGKSQFAVYGKKISHGYPEPDLHGTLMLTWALSEMEALTSSSSGRDFGELRP